MITVERSLLEQVCSNNFDQLGLEFGGIYEKDTYYVHVVNVIRDYVRVRRTEHY